MSDDIHIPVMLDEVIDYLNIRENGLYIDCTCGFGGHSEAILKRKGRVIGIDRDPDAVAYTREKFSGFGDSFKIEQARFSGITYIAGEQCGAVDGVLMDLGVSSKMLDDPARGFSYRHEGPLLMTMDQTGTSAYDLVNSEDEGDLARIFRDYGEERNARRIARRIVERRKEKPIETTTELSDIIEQVSPKFPQKSKSRIFQALRLVLNDELSELREGLDGALEVLAPHGRLVVISYHSLEDRMTKRFMREKASPCICPPGFPECRCGKKAEVTLLKRKALRPTEAEVKRNPRARSALLRVCEKLDTGGES